MTTRTESSRAQPLVAQLGYIQQALGANTRDVSHEESLIGPPAGGNCLNWVVGHVVATRNQTLELLGKPPVWSDETAARYRRGQGPIAGGGLGVVDFAEILEAFEASQRDLVEGLAAIADAELDQTVPWFGAEAPKATALAGLVFHEAYHVGQTGLLRRALGKPGAIA